MKSKKWLIVLLAVGVFGITNTEMGIMGILPVIAQDFHVTIATSGLLVSAFAIIVAICGPILPPFFARFNQRNIMIWVLTIFIFSNVLSALTHNFIILLIARIIPAFFQPVYVSLAFTMAARLATNSAEIPKATAKIFIGVSSGMVLGVPVTTFVANYLNFAAAMWLFALINILVLVATIHWLPAMTTDPTTTISYRQQLRQLLNLQTIIAVLTVVALNAGVFGLYSYLSNFLKDISNLNASWISIILMIYGLANIVGNLLAGQMLISKPQVLIFSLPAFLIIADGLLFIFSQMLVLVIILSFGLGVLAGIAANVNQYLVNQALPKTPELANGIFLTGANLGTTVGSLLCGVLISQSNASGAIAGAILFQILTIILVTLLAQFPHKIIN